MYRTTANLLFSIYGLAEDLTREALTSLRTPSGKKLSRMQIRRLEQNGYLSKQRAPSGEWVYRLTATGKLAAVGGRDPEAAWSREWDGHWRFLIYDIPRSEAPARKKLSNWLKANHFGRLQDSVWISPDPLEEAKECLSEFGSNRRSILLIDGSLSEISKPSRSGSVDSAWDFDEINREYRHYLRSFGNLPRRRPSAEWLDAESRQWHRAICMDPLLPASLLPTGYLGKKAWASRRKLSRIGRKDA